MPETLAADVVRLAEPSSHPDGEPFRALSVKNVQALAERYRIPGRDVEITALKSNILPQRYSRNMKAFSLRQQAEVLGSSVTVVGLGGLGGTVAELLARTGVGTLHVVDGDRFEESNLNRQALCTEETLEMTKVSAAVNRIRAINSSIVVSPHETYLTEETGPSIIGDSLAVVDCLGGVTERFMLEKAAKQAARPLISAAMAGLSGHVTTIFPEDRGLELIYGNPRDLPSDGAEAVLGCPPQTMNILASCQCSEVVKVLLKQENVLRNRMLALDLEDYTFEIVSLYP